MKNSFAFLRVTLPMALMASAATWALGGRSALAQTVSPPSSPSSGDNQLTEVVVTATKRSEDIQKVPIAVDAYSRQDLDRLGATSIQDVAKFAPNVQLFDSYAGAQPTWVIRGIGLQDFNPNNTPAASIFIDDVYQISNVMGGASLFDTDRVEVLKGPQGGLYGRNTIGGAVQIITHHPDFDHFTGEASVSDGSWDDIQADGAVGGPIMNGLAFRLAGTIEKSTGGWQRSLADGETWDKKSSGALRLEVEARPTQALSIRVNLHTSEDTSELPLAEAIGIFNAAGGFCAPVLAGHANNAECLDLAQVLGESTKSPSVQGSNGYLSLSQPFNRLDNHAYGGSVNVEYKLDGMTLTSTTSVDEFNYGLDYNFAGTSQTLGNYVQRTPMISWSQDIRLASATQSAFDWIVGVDLAYDRLAEHRYFITTDNTALNSSLGLPNFAGDFYLHYIQNTTYGGIYGQGAYHFNDKLSLNFGLRESNETKNYKDGSFELAVFGIDVSKGNTENYALKDHISGSVGIDYQFNGNILGYVKISRGYKSGGFFGGFPLNLQQIKPYKEEIVLDYEGGVKAETPDHHFRVNASIYNYDISNFQGFTEELSNYSHTIVNVLSNLGDAVDRGAELEVSWLPIHGLTISSSGGYIDAEITKSDATFDDIVGNVIPYAGSRIPYAPRWSADEYVRYERHVSDDLVAGVQMDYDYRSTLETPRGVINGAIGKIPGYGLLDARIDLHKISGQWTFALYGKNITNQRYVTTEGSDGAGSQSDVFAPPASYGIKISKKF